MICSECPRNCGAVRTAEAGNGVCGYGTTAHIARAAPHFWEEPCVSGEKGSGTVF
ncbi:MAG TPA: radical SAM protein, partial [Clostridiales bacterium]|nr:radical SAM protein [Clostridiales bacterium]